MEQNILEKILEGSMKPTNLPLETLRGITDDFSTDRIIGEGGFGTVYKGVAGNENVAVKRIMSSKTIDQKLFRREVDSLMEVNHQNIVRFLGLCSHTVETPMKNPESPGYIYVEIRERLLCFEYISNGSLLTKIADELRGLEWDKRYKIITGICAGLHYLHVEKHILHMDLKPANILLDKEMVPKITDFGLSRPAENSQTTSKNHFTTPGYCAPENMFGRGRMSVKSDIYSLGVIIIELVTGHKGIPDNNHHILRRWRHRWSKSANDTPLEYNRQVTTCIEIGSLCQKISPYARPSISEIMSKFAGLESTNNHNRSANELTEVNPLYSEDDMLGVEPLELEFRHSNENQQILSCSVELSNDTDGFIAFDIKTTTMLPYSIEPNKDIVKPGSKYRVDITLPSANARDHKASRQYNINKQCTEEFIVRSIKVNEVLPAEDINEHMFDEHTAGHYVDEIILAVICEEACREEEGDTDFATGVEYDFDGMPEGGGVFVLIVHEARHVKGKHHTNPYAKIEFQGDTMRTRTIKKTQYPRWNEEFFFVCEEPPTHEKMHIEVMSRPPIIGIYSKESIGHVSIMLTDVVPNKRIIEKYHLINSKNAWIQVEFEWRPSRNTSRAEAEDL